MQVMHGEDYVCLGFLFGEKCRVAYLSDVSRFPADTEYGRPIFPTDLYVPGILNYSMSLLYSGNMTSKHISEHLDS